MRRERMKKGDIHMEALKDIPLEDLTLALGQARTKLDGQAIDELARASAFLGLLSRLW